MQLNKIDRPNIADTVIQQLLDQLLSGKLKVGDCIPSEIELSNQLGIGRNTVREALKVLQVLGIIERHQGHGSYISRKFKLPFGPFIFSLLSQLGTSIELAEIRRVLEIGVMDLVIEKATAQDFESIRAKLERFIYWTAQHDWAEAVEADMAFHLEIVAATKNIALLELAKLVMRLFKPSMANQLKSAKGFKVSTAAHREILKALEARDRDRARLAMIKSYNRWMPYIKLSAEVNKLP
jgi:GntR family transcriptional regulator, transcriptional repressor for pyruvate dehydrogenase complex